MPSVRSALEAKKSCFTVCSLGKKCVSVCLFFPKFPDIFQSFVSFGRKRCGIGFKHMSLSLCDECEESTATQNCVDCKQRFCSLCNQTIHKVKKRKTHQWAPIKVPNKQLPAPQAPPPISSSLPMSICEKLCREIYCKARLGVDAKVAATNPQHAAAAEQRTAITEQHTAAIASEQVRSCSSLLLPVNPLYRYVSQFFMETSTPAPM